MEWPNPAVTLIYTADKAWNIVAGETERLYALIDGLALHHLKKGDEVTPELMEAVIALHLESLCNRNS
ncbi:TetR family transcriptional regulator C-terminal domain-containing protein [Peribacillus sp. B-H-3]|jgi:hypothetical protein|uniref:TetR family transcriptional regulator C-terminal domain-containing protein n=1 Tax=Peribacillus sp. B-H-3 TaxID=3400420 RepID=UPI003B027553